MKDDTRHRYGNIDRHKVDFMLTSLRQSGATVSGDNPWEVDTHQSGIRLMGQLDEGASILEITLVDRDWYVPCSMVWQKLDELVRDLQATPGREERGDAASLAEE